MKILLTQHIAAISGSEKYYFKLLKGLKKKPIEIKFLAIILNSNKKTAQAFCNEIENLGVTCDKIFINSTASLKIFKRLITYLNKNNFDIVHSNLIHTDFWFGIVKNLVKKKYKFVSEKHGYSEKYFENYGITSKKIPYDAFWLISKIAELFVDKAIAKSEGIKNLYLNLKISKANKIETIYHGFDFEEKIFNNIKNKTILILGRLSVCKGLSEALQAFKIVNQKYNNYKLQLVGSGVLKDKLQKQTEILGIKNKVEFIGFVKNVDEYLSKASIKLVSSKGEGFGLVFVEAIEHKLPIVAFDVPAGNEIIIKNKTGLLAKPFDVNDLASKIIYFIENEEQQKNFAEAAFEDAKHRFSMQKMIESTFVFYKKVMK